MLKSNSSQLLRFWQAAFHLASEAAFQVHPEMETKCCHKNNSHMVKGTHHVQVKDEAHFTHKFFPSFPIAAKLLLPPCLDCNSKAYEMGFEP